MKKTIVICMLLSVAISTRAGSPDNYPNVPDEEKEQRVTIPGEVTPFRTPELPNTAGLLVIGTGLLVIVKRFYRRNGDRLTVPLDQ